MIDSVIHRQGGPVVLCVVADSTVLAASVAAQSRNTRKRLIDRVGESYNSIKSHKILFFN
jgi:hypothetical protein